MNYFEVFILALVEGLTEFLPVSSTGHLIITSSLFGIQEQGFVKAFNVIIQLGAILSVLFIYWRRFLPNFSFYQKLLVAFVPAAVIGLLVKSKIDAVLDNVLIVGTTTLLGGFILIWSDHFFTEKNRPVTKDIDTFCWKDALKLGFIQCLAFLPGTSRSGSTIIGGLFLGLNRKSAAEFSFFLAIPTLVGAAAVKSVGLMRSIESDQIGFLLVGILLSFIFALISVKFMISVVTRYGFKYFGYYRIVLGILILGFYFRGLI